ncbi:exported hypothetical protein [groundwater metagenome]|uniref:Thioredoxin domain-containing protein n=1 Tax=groundwater metagenome TaxID=717931 RepID=A0A098E6A1_9ZZZZ
MGQNLKILKLIGIFAGIFLIAAAMAAVNASSNTNNTEIIDLNISPVKDVYYVGDEITINFVLTPNKNGCFGTLIFTKINSSVDTLFHHETGCKSCGLAKQPLTSKTTAQKKKKFDESGIYEIEGMIKDAGTYESEFKKMKIIVKDKVVKDDVVKDKVVKDDDNYISDTDENNSQIPIVMEVFTHYGCPICEHVDEGAKKLSDEYNKRTKNSIILLEYHLQDTLATQAGLDRRIFYGGAKWQNTCNYYSLILINGEDEDCGGTHNTENDYRNFKNKVENKNLIPTVNMRANASYDNTSLYVDVKIKATRNEVKNLNVFLFIADDTNVKGYIRKSARIDNIKEEDVKFSFPYSENFTYKNLRVVAVVQEDKKILNARLIERNDIREIKEPKEITKIKNSVMINRNVTYAANNSNVTNITYTANVTITNSIDFMYCAKSRDMLYCAIKLTLLSFGDFKDLK